MQTSLAPLVNLLFLMQRLGMLCRSTKLTMALVLCIRRNAPLHHITYISTN